jgi:hypothetical protein
MHFTLNLLHIVALNKQHNKGTMMKPILYTRILKNSFDFWEISQATWSTLFFRANIIQNDVKNGKITKPAEYTKMISEKMIASQAALISITAEYQKLWLDMLLKPHKTKANLSALPFALYKAYTQKGYQTVIANSKRLK